MSVDAAGVLYITDTGNHVVRKVTPGGTITTIAGTGVAGFSGDGGPATAAQLRNPQGIGTDAAGNVYIADTDNYRIRRIAPGGTITTVVGTGVIGSSGDGGPATAAQLRWPKDVEVAPDGTLYIVDLNDHRIRKVTPGGTISTLAGTGAAGYSGDGGPADSAQLNAPLGAAVSDAGEVFIADRLNHRIRKVDGSGTITTVVGTGSPGFGGDGGMADAATINAPQRIDVGHDGHFLFTDAGNRRVRRVESLAEPAPPTLSSSVPGSPSNDNFPRIVGSAAAGMTVRLYTNAGCTSAVAATGTSAELASPGLAVTVPTDSTTTFWATATDGAGRVSNCSSTSVIYVEDSVAPGVPSITGAPAAASNDDTPVWTFTGPGGGAQLECRLVRSGDPVPAWTTCTSPQAPDLGSQGDGTYTFSVRSFDAAGNRSASADSSFVLDRAAPAAPSITSAPAAASNDDTPTWGVSGEPGATLECRVARGAVEVVVWSTCPPTGTFDLSGEVDGTYDFGVRAVDAAGNTGPTTSGGYLLDRVAPATPSITSSPPAQSRDTTPTWSFTGDGGYECRLSRGSTVIADWAACSSPHTATLSTDGAHTFDVRSRDAAGNAGGVATATFTLDTVAPATPAITSAPPALSNDATPTVAFTGESGAAFTCRVERGGAVVVDWTSCTSAWTSDLAGEVDGAYDLRVRAADAAGNIGSPSTASYTLDRAVPGAPTIGSGPGATGNDRQPAWSFTAAAGTTTECRFDYQGAQLEDWGPCLSPRPYDLLLSPDGSYVFGVRAVSAAGTPGPARTSTYLLDTAAPGAPAITARPATPANNTTPTWSFAGEGGARLECRIARGGTIVSNWGTCTSAWTYDIGGEVDGAYDFSVRAVDAAGNVSVASVDTYTLDRSVPAAPVIDGRPVDVGSGHTLTWTVTPAAATTLECRLDRASGAMVADWAACTSPVSFDVPDGAFVFSVRSVSGAGNRSAPVTDDFAVDGAAPDAPVFVASPGAVGASVSPQWSFTAEAGSTVECRLSREPDDGTAPWQACTSPFVADLSAHEDGAFGLTLRAIDGAGNASERASSTYVLDRVAPPAPQIVAGPGPLGSARSVGWTFTAPDAARVSCRLSRGDAVVVDWSDCASPRGFDLSGQPDGPYTFSVRSFDAAGHASAVAVSDYELDGAHVGPLLTSTPGPVGRSRRPVWGFEGEMGALYACTLTRAGVVVLDVPACLSPQAWDLARQPDGVYVFALRGTDRAGNASTPLTSSYELDTTPPGAPSIRSAPESPGRDRSPAWSFRADEQGDRLECRLSREDASAGEWAACTSPEAFDLDGRAAGTFVFGVRATDAAGNTGKAATSEYVLQGASEPSDAPAASPVPAPASPGPETASERAPSSSRERASAPAPRRRARRKRRAAPPAAEDAVPVAPAGRPRVPVAPRRGRHARADERSVALKTAAQAADFIAKNPDKSVFPMSLLIAVGLFFLIQGRLDRADPKLAMAPVFADPELEYPEPPTTGGDA